jgi:uncharacterized protein
MINIREVYEGAINELSIDMVIPAEKLWQTEASYLSDMAVKGVITNRSGIVRIQVTFDAYLNEICDRCLTQLRRHFIYTADYILIADDNADSDEYIIVDGKNLDIVDVAVDNFFLFHPSKILCKENCLGLDPETGENLNNLSNRTSEEGT